MLKAKRVVYSKKRMKDIKADVRVNDKRLIQFKVIKFHEQTKTKIEKNHDHVTS